MSLINMVLTKCNQLGQQKKESDEEFSKRVVEGLTSLPEGDWRQLPDAVQIWSNRAAAAAQTGILLPKACEMDDPNQPAFDPNSAPKVKAKKVKKAQPPQQATTTGEVDVDAKAPKEPKAPKAPKALSAINAAAIVLDKAGTPLTTSEMITQMTDQGLWTSPGGKTPAATLYAAILREIGVKLEKSRFVKTQRGKFGLVGVSYPEPTPPVPAATAAAPEVAA